MSSTTPNLGLFKYNTSTDGKEVFSIQAALNDNWDILDERCGSQRNIGEIVESTIPLTDPGLHLLDGVLLQYGSYSAFIDYIADLYDSGNYTSIFDTEVNWQTAVATYGVCGKFVYDSVNNTVRLPKITGIIEGTTDLTALGDLVEAGLPNITGSIGYTYTNSSAMITGVFEITSQTGKAGAGTSAAWTSSSFDASRSSSIYGNSSTVQPQTIKVLYYIVIATSTKTEIEVDIDEIATDLNGKADKDLTNCIGSLSASSKHYMATLAYRLDWDNAITVTTTTSNNANVSYTFPADGMLLVYAYGSGSTSNSKHNYARISSANGSIYYDGGLYASNVAMSYNDQSAHYFGIAGEKVEYYVYSVGWSSNVALVRFVPLKKA